MKQEKSFAQKCREAEVTYDKARQTKLRYNSTDEEAIRIVSSNIVIKEKQE